MRVVVDTNVVVSAILRDRNPERAIVHLVESADWEWVASSDILAEYRAVLRRPKFALPATMLEEWDERFRKAIVLWPVTLPPEFQRDPKDAKFIACVLASEADYLLTGDRDFESATGFPGVQTVGVSQFVSQFCR
jgi:putative PIN family toxin of toxin-antitoxin system